MIMIPFGRALALQHTSRNCSPAPDLVFCRPIFQQVFSSGGLFFHRRRYLFQCRKLHMRLIGAESGRFIRTRLAHSSSVGSSVAEWSTLCLYVRCGVQMHRYLAACCLFHIVLTTPYATAHRRQEGFISRPGSYAITRVHRRRVYMGHVVIWLRVLFSVAFHLLSSMFSKCGIVCLGSSV